MFLFFVLEDRRAKDIFPVTPQFQYNNCNLKTVHEKT